MCFAKINPWRICCNTSSSVQRCWIQVINATRLPVKTSRGVSLPIFFSPAGFLIPHRIKVILIRQEYYPAGQNIYSFMFQDIRLKKQRLSFLPSFSPDGLVKTLHLLRCCKFHYQATPSHWIAYSGMPKGHNIQTRGYMTLVDRGDTGLIISIAVPTDQYDKYAPIFCVAIDSITLN